MSGQYKYISCKASRLGGETPAGELSIIVGRVGVIDRDGDVIMPGAIKGRQPVVFGDWNHDHTRRGGQLLGKGQMYEDGDVIRADVQMNMKSQRARELWDEIEFYRDDIEFSATLVSPVAPGQIRMGGRQARALRELRGIEISPATAGVQYGTGVVGMKSEAAAAVTDIMMPAASAEAQSVGGLPPNITVNIHTGPGTAPAPTPATDTAPEADVSDVDADAVDTDGNEADTGTGTGKAIADPVEYVPSAGLLMATIDLANMKPL